MEVYCQTERFALHLRKPHSKAYTTLGEHMPPNHPVMQQIKGLNKQDLLAQAASTGTAVLQVRHTDAGQKYLDRAELQSLFWHADAGKEIHPPAA